MANQHTRGASSLTLEHLSSVVYNSMLTRVSHPAAAQRMGSDDFFSKHFRPHGILYKCSSQVPGYILQFFVHSFEILFVANSVPRDVDIVMVTVESNLTAGVIVAHAQERHCFFHPMSCEFLKLF